MEVTVHGKFFPTLRAASRHFDLKESTVQTRLGKGMPVEEAFQKGRIVRSPRYRDQTFRGRKFRSFAELCRAYGVERGTAKSRISRGWTTEQALGLEPPPQRKRRFHRGEKFAETEIDGCIYLIACRESGKSYVGLTTDDPIVRFESHVDLANSKIELDKRSLQYAIRKFGRDAFELEVIDTAETIAELAEKERRAIEEHDTKSPHGYNLNGGGALGGMYRKRVEIDGRKFKSLNDACAFFGRAPSIVSCRLAFGWPLERALKVPPGESRKVGRKPITFRGVDYPGRKELAAAYGVPSRVLLNRLRGGWSVEDAVMTPVGEVRSEAAERTRAAVSKSVRIEGKDFVSISEASAHYGLSAGCVYSRLKKGWSLTEAFGLDDRSPPHNAPKELVIRGRTHASIQEACRFHGVSYALFKHRRKRGWGVERALVTPVKKLETEIRVRGRRFGSIREAAQQFNLQPGTVSYRLVNGWSVEEALGIVKRRR